MAPTLGAPIRKSTSTLNGTLGKNSLSPHDDLAELKTAIETSALPLKTLEAINLEVKLTDHPRRLSSCSRSAPPASE